MRAKLFGGNALVYILTRFVVACLFVLFPISCMAYNNDSNNEVVYYWKVKNGKKALARKVVSKNKGECSDVVLTPYKYDVSYGGKGALKLPKYSYNYYRAFNNKNNNFFFDKYSIVYKSVSFSKISHDIHLSFAVKTNDGYGFIDENGNEIVPCRYKDWKPLTQHFYSKSDFFHFLESNSEYLWYGDERFLEAYVQLFTKTGKWQLVSFSRYSKKLSKEYDYDEVKFFSHYWDYKYRWFDKKPTVYSDLEYNTGFSTYKRYSDFNPINTYVATRKGNKWGIFDYVSGEECVPCEFDISSFANPNKSGLVITKSDYCFFLKKDWKRYIVDNKGKILLSDQTNTIYPSLVTKDIGVVYVTDSGRKFMLNGDECYMTDSFYRWLGWGYTGTYIVKENSLYGIYNGKTDYSVLSCNYKDIYFDEDNTGFLTLVLPDGKKQTACLNADASMAILLKNKSDILQHCTIVSNKDGYTTYKLGNGYGFSCNSTGIFTAPIFKPDTTKLEKNILPLCQFYRGDNHGAFVGNMFFCPKYSYNISQYKDTLYFSSSVPYKEGGKYINGKWTEKIYKENGKIMTGNNWSTWNNLLNSHDTKAVYLALDSIFSELGNIPARGFWCYNYGLALCRKGNFENGVEQLKRIKSDFGMEIVDKDLMKNLYLGWMDYSVYKKNYDSSILAYMSALSDGIDMDKACLKSVLHDGPIYYAENGDYETAMSLYKIGKDKLGIDEGNSFINLIHHKYNLYLAKKEAKEREMEAKQRQEEAERQAELQRQQQEALRRYQERMQAINNLSNSLSNLARSISNVENIYKKTNTKTVKSAKTSGQSVRTYNSSNSNASVKNNRKKTLGTMSTLRYTYDKYISRLIDMNVNYEKKYNNKERIECQRKARDIRITAEKYSNCSVFKSKWEDWDGSKQ